MKTDVDGGQGRREGAAGQPSGRWGRTRKVVGGGGELAGQ